MFNASLNPLLLGLVFMLGSENYRARQVATQVLRGTPEARFAATLLGSRNPESDIRTKALTRQWDHGRIVTQPLQGHIYILSLNGGEPACLVEVWEIFNYDGAQYAQLLILGNRSAWELIKPQNWEFRGFKSVPVVGYTWMRR